MASSLNDSAASGEPRFATKPESSAEAGIAQEPGIALDRSAEKSQDGAKPNEAAVKPAAVKPAVAVQEKPKEVELDASVLVDDLLAARLSPEELDQGWIRLFDGQSMIGWKNTSSADWAVKDGELVANVGDPGLLVTQVRFSDYEIELEYFASEQTNSGLFLRTPEQPTDPAKDCYELNIAPPDNPFPTGSLVARAKVNESIDEPNGGQWNTLHALVDQNRIQAWVNGQQSVDYTDDSGLVSGRIGLQFREGPIRFRNIRIRPIGYSLIPNAKPSDWNEPKGTIEAKFTETGTIQLKGGRGHLELLQPHANVCIQATALTLVENVNSGIFFRCIPGEDMNGYECQIHHGFKEDRRRAVDAGSGSIFRRQNAKAVLSDEGRPAHVTIVADGPVMATWVEGVQVVQWEDTRKPDDNPRKGLRTAAGTIMLQGHDPTTEIEFTRLLLSPISDGKE
ncbi:MAG: DUF1080 domain-containing protein [Pirellula sp.]